MTQKVSILHLPITFKKSDLERSINTLTKGVVFEDTNLDEDNMMLKIKKNENIRIELSEHSMWYQVPLDIWVKKDIGLTNIEAFGQIVVKCSTAYEIKSDWQFKTNTDILDYHWIQKPSARFSVFEVSIKYIADKVLQRSKKSICNLIDQQLAARFNLRTHVFKAWNLLQQPIRISKEIELIVKPQKMAMTSVVVNDNKLAIKLLIEAHTDAYIKNSPPILNRLQPLPAFHSINIKREDFELNLNAIISYQAIEQLVKDVLTEEPVSVQGRTINISDISLESKGQKVTSRAILSGGFNGTLFLIGRPIYNALKNQIEFEDLELQLNSKNLFMKGLGWVFQTSIESHIRKKLIFPLNESLLKAKSLAQKTLDNYEPIDNIFLNGQLKDISVSEIYVEKTGIKVQFISNGNLKVLIGGL